MSSAVPTYTTLVGRQGKEGAFASHHSSDRWDDKPKNRLDYVIHFPFFQDRRLCPLHASSSTDAFLFGFLTLTLTYFTLTYLFPMTYISLLLYLECLFFH